jgi:15-cis-phytoene synthase
MTATTERVSVNEMALQRSREYCRELTKRAAKNFYYGLKLLPEPKRSAMYAMYAYMRLVDDIADDDGAGRTVEQRRKDLDRWEEWTRQAVGGGDVAELGDDPVWPAFVEMVRTNRVPAAVFQDMIAGQRQDLEPVGMADFAALYAYCYRVASVVGVATLYVFGFEGGDETLKLGVDRGVAFQLTNILRDLREDAAPPRHRCYVPVDEMVRFGVTAGALARGEDSPGYRELMAFQVARAREYYQRSSALEQRVEADARPTLAAMTAIYRGILEKIAARPEDVLRGTVRLSTWAKLRIGWRTMRGHYS